MQRPEVDQKDTSCFRHSQVAPEDGYSIRIKEQVRLLKEK